MKQKPAHWEDRHYADEPDPLYVTVPPPELITKSTAEDVLDESHQRAFSRAVSNVLSTPIAEETFAQIVDGLPLEIVALTTRRGRMADEDPCLNHVALCPGALEKTKEYRTEFNPGRLNIAATALQRYQNTPVGSKASKMPFIELVAVAVHSIAVELMNLDVGLHKDATRPSEEASVENTCSRRRATPFKLRFYSTPEQYPDGAAEMAGYWAEDRIFGGVVLFGRGEDGTGYDGVWLHSHRTRVTRRIYELTEDQRLSLLRFLEKEQMEDDDSASPLPILGDRNNRRRVDPEIAMPEFNVYRDRWERTVDCENWGSYRTPSGRNHVDYPELEDQYLESLSRSEGNA
ncbi:hypothetical protein Daus18300_006340 [Diaporthe australafricana]|uniref:Uncharacterized protein n=1 Tax=Diaporthe australafricana TaxID=127596 RepID=A0ABR3WV18_9PEZI